MTKAFKIEKALRELYPIDGYLIFQLSSPPDKFWEQTIEVDGETILYRRFSPQHKGEKSAVGYCLPQELIYQPSTETIRQMPENYLIAHKYGNRWICDPDGAADKGLATKIFLALFEHENCYGSGEKLLEAIKEK